MSWRTRGALVGLLVAVCGCATSGDSGSGPGATADASLDVTGGGDVVIGPSPDAVVPGIDASSSSGGEAGGDDDAADPEDAAEDGHPSKSCVGLSDGTPCGAAPDICHNAPLCEGGSCAAAAPKSDGFVCGTAPDACHDAPTCK